MRHLGAFPAAGAADEGDALVLLGVEHLLERRLANAVDVRRQLLHPALPEHSLDLLGVDVQLAAGVDGKGWTSPLTPCEHGNGTETEICQRTTIHKT